MIVRALLTDKLDVGGQFRYAWQQQQADYDTGDDIDLPGGYSGTTTVNYALELNNADIDVTAPVAVWVQARGSVDGLMVWEFAAPAPQGGVTGSGSDNEVTRWDGARAVQGSFAVLEDDGRLTLNTTGTPSSSTTAISLIPTTGVCTLEFFPSGTGGSDGQIIQGTSTTFGITCSGISAGWQLLVTAASGTSPVIADFNASANPFGVTVRATKFGIHGGSDGASATTGGLTFAGGLYTGGTATGGVTSVSGTTNQIASTGGTTPVLSLAGPHDFTTQTAHGVLLGEGTSAIVATAAMTDGQLLVGQTGADPLPKTVSGSGATITMGPTGVVTISAIANASLSNSSVTITAGTGLTGGGVVALGASVTLNVDTGTSGHKVPFLDGANTWSAAQTVTVTDAVTNAASDVLILDHESSGTPTSPFGEDVHFRLKSSTTASQEVAVVRAVWLDATHATRAGMLQFYVYDVGTARQALSLGVASSAASIGFLGATAVVRQTGDAGTALVTFGLMSGTPTFAAANLTGTTLPAAIVTSSLTSVGTIGTGVWQGTKVGLAYGGTNADLSATGGAKSYLKQSSSGAAVTVGTIPAGDYPDFVAAGGSHAPGGVPDPGSTAHTNEPFILGDNGSFASHKGRCLGQNFTATSETTTSTTPVDLTTAQSITFTTDVAGGTYNASVSCTYSNNTAGGVGRIYVYDGSTATLVGQFAAKDANTNYNISCVCFPITGLGAAAQDIRMRFSVNAGTGTFSNRAFRVDRGSN